MSQTFVITGTDTGLGKTVFATALVIALKGTYWKPVQAGLDDETDSETVVRLSSRPVLPEAYRLALPASPHLAAEAEGIEIDTARLTLPIVEGALIVEGAGGVLVPLNRRILYADLFARWQAPVILCARTQLGTINHSLTAIEALRSRGVPIHGIAFLGEPAPAVEATICEFGKVKRLGRLPILPVLSRVALSAAFCEGFGLEQFSALEPGQKAG